MVHARVIKELVGVIAILGAALVGCASPDQLIVSIEPTAPGPADDLVAQIDGDVADLDLNYRWYRGGEQMPAQVEAQVPADVTAAGDTWAVIVTAHAADGGVRASGSAATRIETPVPPRRGRRRVPRGHRLRRRGSVLVPRCAGGVRLHGPRLRRRPPDAAPRPRSGWLRLQHRRLRRPRPDARAGPPRGVRARRIRRAARRQLQPAR